VEYNKCNFENLWLLVLCSYIIGPLVIGIPATFLIPNVSQRSDLLKIDREHDNEVDDSYIYESKTNREYERLTFNSYSDDRY